MRKNSVRKWLHAILDLLPLFVIPIFAIYTRNENYNSNIEVQTYENKLVDFNQYRIEEYKEGTFTSTSQYQIFESTNVPLQYGHQYYVSLYLKSSNNNNLYLRLGNPASAEYIFIIENIPSTYQFYNYKATLNYVSNNYDKAYFMQANTNYGTYDYKDFMIIDLTQMYGEGNEPTTQEFRQQYSEPYYNYTISHKELIPNVLTTYNDTDVGSQFVYTLYNATDKYFNCTNLFNLEQVWNWVQLNLFSGNAPLMVYVVWQVIVYEFFMDLIFLLYSVFMFVIDFAQDCLEKPFNRIRRL